MAAAHARLTDFRDLDLLIRFAEGDELGRLSSTDLAELVGLPAENGGGQAMGVRLAWMKRYGFVVYDDKEHVWALSSAGRRVSEAHLRASAQKTIQAVPDESLVEVMAHVTSRFRLGDPVNAHLLRREFLFGTQKR
jgi:hypothetical protein